jgi:protocatechuate 3,4-dioxygenase beta subunit
MYETGEPVNGIIVAARALRSNSQTIGFYNCITDEKGFYALSKLSGGMYTVNIQPDSTFAGWVAAPKENVGTGRGETQENVDFKLIRGIPVSGRVIEKETGNPVPGVRVSSNISIKSGRTMLWFGSGTKTGNDGRYSIGVIPGEIYVIAIPPEGFFEGGGSKRIIVSEQKQIEDVDIQIQRGVEVNGIIHLPDGTPAADIIIKNCNMPGKGVNTGQDGKFTISGILPGSNYTFHAAKPKSKLESFFTVKVIPGVNVDVTLHEPRYVCVSGTVVDYNNKPAQGLVVNVANMEDLWLKLYPVSSISDSAGKFTIKDLIPDMHYKLDVQDGMANSPVFIAGEDPGPFLIVLPRNDRWLEGTVRNAEGKPLVNAEISAWGIGHQKTVCDQKGRFRLNGIVSEKVELTVNGFIFPNIATNQIREFLLPTERHSLSGKVTDPDGKPLAGAIVAIDRSLQGLASIKVQADSGGYFYFSGPAFKEETLIIDHPMYRTEKVEIKLDREDLRIILQPTGENRKK